MKGDYRRRLQKGEAYEKFCVKKLEEKYPEYLIQRTKKGRYGSDGGIDFVFRKQGDKIICLGQAKNWKRNSRGKAFIPVKEIRELGGCMLRENVKNGIFVSNLPISKKGRIEAKKMNIEILNLKMPSKKSFILQKYFFLIIFFLLLILLFAL